MVQHELHQASVSWPLGCDRAVVEHGLDGAFDRVHLTGLLKLARQDDRTLETRHRCGPVLPRCGEDCGRSAIGVRGCSPLPVIAWSASDPQQIRDPCFDLRIRHVRQPLREGVELCGRERIGAEFAEPRGDLQRVRIIVGVESEAQREGDEQVRRPSSRALLRRATRIEKLHRVGP